MCNRMSQEDILEPFNCFIKIHENRNVNKLPHSGTFCVRSRFFIWITLFNKEKMQAIKILKLYESYFLYDLLSILILFLTDWLSYNLDSNIWPSVYGD